MKNQSRHGAPAAANRRRARARCVRIALLACCALAAAAGHAERADRDKPVNLEADQVTVDDNKQTATFVGKVVLTQGTLVIRGDRMVVQQDADGFKRGVAFGNLASFRQKREGYDEYIDGYAERIEYDSKADLVKFIRRAVVRRYAGATLLDETTGSAITYDNNTDVFTVDGGEQNRTAANPDGRVRLVIQPKSKDKPAAAPPLSLQPATGVANPRENPPGAPR